MRCRAARLPPIRFLVNLNASTTLGQLFGKLYASLPGIRLSRVPIS